MPKSKKSSKGKESKVSTSSGAASGRDQKIGGDVISVSNVGDGAAVAAGRGASASIRDSDEIHNVITIWLSQMEEKIEANEQLSTEDKKDAKEQVSKIAEELKKGESVDKNRLEKLVNVLSVMAPDIFEVAIATLANPLAGLGLAFKKIGDKAKVLNQAEA